MRVLWRGFGVFVCMCHEIEWYNDAIGCDGVYVTVYSSIQ